MSLLLESTLTFNADLQMFWFDLQICERKKDVELGNEKIVEVDCSENWSRPFLKLNPIVKEEKRIHISFGCHDSWYQLSTFPWHFIWASISQIRFGSVKLRIIQGLELEHLFFLQIIHTISVPSFTTNCTHTNVSSNQVSTLKFPKVEKKSPKKFAIACGVTST